MKKIILFFLTVIFVSASTEIYTYNLKLNYKEYINGKVIDRDYNKYGDILGIGIKYYKNSFFDYYLKAEYSGGNSYYKGSSWNGVSLNSKQSGFYLLNLEAGIGKYFYFFGGYRLWNRGKSHVDGDYNERYYWKYIGFKYSYKINFDKFYFYPEMGYKIAINPKMKIKLGNEPILDLGTTTGKFLELPFYYKYSNNIDFKIFYKYEYWHINPSNINVLVVDNHQYSIFEPESKTKNQYFGIGIIINF
jgi:hypothetical protein